MKKFCSVCGKEFESTSNRQYVCPECKEEQHKKTVKAQAIKTKQRQEEKGLVSAMLYKEDREFIKKLAKEHECVFADELHRIIERIKDGINVKA